MNICESNRSKYLFFLFKFKFIFNGCAKSVAELGGRMQRSYFCPMSGVEKCAALLISNA